MSSKPSGSLYKRLAQNLQGVFTKGELDPFKESIQKVSSKPSGSLYKRRARLLQGVYSKGALNPFRESIQKVSSKPSGSLYKRLATGSVQRAYALSGARTL